MESKRQEKIESIALCVSRPQSKIQINSIEDQKEKINLKMKHQGKPSSLLLIISLCLRKP